MNRPEFDQYAHEYDQLINHSIPKQLNEEGYFDEYKIALTYRRTSDNVPLRILDFGCGSGRGLPYFEKYFPKSELWGYDVSPESLEVARERVSTVELVHEWETIAEQRFDLIFTANVFHHIPIEERQSALNRCRDVLNEGGQMFLFEHNPYNPATRWIFDRCPFDVDAEMLPMRQSLQLARKSGLRVIHTGYTLFFPRPLSFLRSLEVKMEWLPIGAQYYVQLAL